MLRIHSALAFRQWIDSLKDRRAAALIFRRIARAQDGNLGDTKSVGGGVSEMRIHHGPGYRVYFTRRGDAVLLLLCGGDKGSQSGDIAEAKRIANEWKE